MLRACYILLPLLLLGNVITTAAEKRYTVRFADGSYHEGDKLIHWHEDSAQPQVDGRSLLDPANPFRFVRDRSLTPGPIPTAFVEMITGDCFPGVVIGYANSMNSWDSQPPFFWVEPQVALQPPVAPGRVPIRILADCVKRIVWQAVGNKPAPPNTLVLRNGSSLRFRAVRFAEQYISVLTNEGNRRFDYQELGELCLPSENFWKQYLAELAVLSPQGDTRLYQLETTDRLRATGSFERLTISSRGNSEEPQHWFHGLQPAWSLDILWIPNANVWMRRAFAPREVSLSSVPPTSVEHTASLGSFHEPWRRDGNAIGDLLRSGKKEVGFGFGTTTTTSLTFSLPVGAKSLRGAVGLDRLAGSGGCARVRISTGEKELTPLWESPVLIGSEQTHDFGSLALPAMNEPQQLILRADALHEGRPAGADPFEVRDFVDWLDPVLKFEVVMWTNQIRKQAPHTIPAWSQWTVDLAPVNPAASAKFMPILDKRVPNQRFFRTGIFTEQPLVLRREIKLEPRDRWLLVFLHRVTALGEEMRLEARVNGELIGDLKVPKWEEQANVERPLAISLAGLLDRREPMELELRLIPGANPGPVEWESIRTSEELPYLRRIFEEQEIFTATPNSAHKPEIISQERAYGVHSLKLAAPGEAVMQFDPPLKIRMRPELGEHRLVRFRVKKKGGGQVLLRWEGNFPASPVEHVIGRGTIKPAAEQLKVWDDEFKDDWVDLNHDLAAYAGNVDITSLTLIVPDGEYAVLDHFYAASTWEDLLAVPRGPVPNSISPELRDSLAAEQRERLEKSLVRIDFGEGRFGHGVLVHGSGEILTAGHLVFEPNRDCTVHFASGKSYPALTRGVCREFDIGLVKLKESFGLYGVGINGWTIPDPNQIHVSARFKSIEKPEEGVEVGVVDLYRTLQSRVWSNYAPAEKLTGSPLLARDGAVLAILHRYSTNGGAVFSALHKWPDMEKRLQNGEVWGQWLAGCSPAFGAELISTPAGTRVRELLAKGPAGLEKDDFIVKIDGIPIYTLQDIDRALGERSPGYEATFQLKRGDQTPEVKIKLAPRTP